jgi:predicted RNA-binding protein with TRAM domain
VYTGAYPAGNVNGSAVIGPEGGLFTVQDNELDGNNAPFATGGITHYATAPIEADYGESSNDAACNNVSYSESAAYTVHSFVTPPVGVTSTPVNKDKNPTSPYLGVTPGTCAGAAPVPATVAEIPNLPGIVLPDPPRQMVDHGLPRSPTRQTSAPSSRVRSEPDAATGAPMTADRLATAGPASDPATPTVDCSGVTGSLTFDPPLSSASKASEMALVHVALSGCHGSGGAPSPTTGNGVTNLFLPTNNCQALLTALSRPTSLAVSWAPSSIGPSDVTFSGETPSTSSDLSFNLGSSASPLHATLKTSVSLSAFESQCAAGVPTLSVSGGSVGTAIDAPSAAAPSSPTAATAFAGNGKATLAWFAPTDTGGSPITGYTITPYLSGTALAPVIVGNVVQTKIKHLTNGDSYTFTVAAINAVGTGPASSLSNAVTPSTLPGAPIGAAAVGGHGSATVSFTPPASNGGNAITGYTVEATDTTTRDNGGQVASGSSSPITVTGLTNGDTYTFTVQATNATGSGSPSVASNAVVPSGAPGAPTGATATANSTAATVSFSPPASNGGSAITGYTVTAADTTNAANGGQMASGGTSPITVTGLTNGDTYTFSVTATNAIGTGPPSGPSTGVVPEPQTLSVTQSGGDTGNCLTSSCATISYAVSQAFPDDTIDVGPGTFPDNVDIPGTLTNLTINGSASGTTVDGNAAGYVFNIEGGASATLNDLTITNGNGAPTNSCGGVCAQYDSGITLTNDTITGNTNGAVSNTGIATLTDDTLSGNDSGFANFETAALTNVTISGNTLTGAGNGAGVFNAGFLTLIGSTIANNSAGGEGGGIYNYHQITLAGTIIGNNMSGSGGVCATTGAGAFVDDGYNLSYDNSCGLSTANNSLINTDPLLGPLQANGGQTETMAPNSDSPVLNQIPDPTTTVAGIALCPGADQRGVARPQGTGCDMGSVELGS